MEERIIKYSIQQVLFMTGIVMFGLSYAPFIEHHMQLWLLAVGVLSESMLVRWIIHVDIKIARKWTSSLLSTLLPIGIILACLFRASKFVG